jgi:hypothetical protein
VDPKPFLEYLDKEMTVMGLLSAFSVALASVAAERVASAEKGLLHCIWVAGWPHVIAGAAIALAAAFLFYLQRSHLAWYYGQIALAQSRGSTSVAAWLTAADGWNAWLRYQTGFIALSTSAAAYAYAVAAALCEPLTRIPTLWSLWVPLVGVIVLALVRWRVLSRFPQEDHPFSAWRRLH